MIIVYTRPFFLDFILLVVDMEGTVKKTLSIKSQVYLFQRLSSSACDRLRSESLDRIG